jgi:hypothetical protein
MDRVTHAQHGEDDQAPFVTFYQLFPTAPEPRRADTSLFGSMPTRAYRYCEPFRRASGLGWHLFAPFAFELQWDGTHIRWRGRAGDAWEVLETVDAPGFVGLWTLQAPIADVLPRPFYALHALGYEPGVVSIWTGVVARTRPDWSLLIRAPVNLPRDPAFEVLDGVIETDWWFGPLVTALQFRKTDVPVRFSPRRPLAQAVPMPRQAYAEELLRDSASYRGLATLGPAEWQAYRETLEPRNLAGARPGWYRGEVQRRRRGAGSDLTEASTREGE